MAKFKIGDLREKALPRVVIDWETGDALFDADSPGYVQGTVALDDGWTVAGIEDSTANDSSKQWEIPAGQEWQILGIGVQYASSGDAGDRQLEVCVQRAGAGFTPIMTWARAGVTQAASLTYEYFFAPGVPDLTSERDTTFVSTPLPVTSLLKAGDVLRVWDNAEIAPAADDMSCYISYAWKAV